MKHKRFMVVVSVGLLLVVTLVYFGFRNVRTNNDKVASTKLCTDNFLHEQLKDKIDIFNPTNVKNLKTVADAIQSKASFTLSPSCLYVVTTYYIDTEDTVKARKYYDLLASSINAQNVYTQVLGAQAQPLKVVEATLKFLESQAKEQTAHITGVSAE